MPRQRTPGENRRRAVAKRQDALLRVELRGPTEARQAAAGVTSLAVKVNPDEALIADFLRAKEGGRDRDA